MKTNKEEEDWPVSTNRDFSEMFKNWSDLPVSKLVGGDMKQMFKNCKATPEMLKKAISDGNVVLVNILKKELEQAK